MDIVTNFRKARRVIASLSLATVIASFFAVGVVQAAHTFTDVPVDHWANPNLDTLTSTTYIEDGVEKTIIDAVLPCPPGVEGNCYRGNDDVNRAEQAKLAVGAHGLQQITELTDAPFNDVPLGEWFTLPVHVVADNGVVEGYRDDNGDLTGFFGPGDDLTRIQSAKINVLAAPLTIDLSCGPSFPDLPVSHWGYEFGETSYANSIFNGDQGFFRPDRNITRYEIAAVTDRSMNPVKRPCAGFNLDDAFATSSTGVMACFTQPVDPVSGALAENYSIMDGVELGVTSATLDADPNCVELTTESQTGGEPYDLTVTDVTSADGLALDNNSRSFTGFLAGAGGGLTCSAGTQPEGVSVPKGATGVPFVVINCTTDAPTTVSGFTLHRFGAGDEADLPEVYMYANGERLTSGRSINSETQNVELGGLNFPMGTGETVEFMGVADIGLTAADASQHGFELLGPSDIDSNASSINGTFPIVGNLMTVSGATAGVVTVEATGTLDDLTIGEKGRVSWFEMENSGAEAAQLDSMALYFRGTCDSESVTDLDLVVESTGEVLAHAEGVTSGTDLATFDLMKQYTDPDTGDTIGGSPFVFEQGDSHNFFVDAKNVCDTGDTIRTYVDEPTDVHVTGTAAGAGFGLSVDTSRPTPGNFDGQVATVGPPAVPDGFSEVLIKGSDFNLAFSGNPPAGEFAIGQDNVTCLDLTVTNAAGEGVIAEDWVMNIAIEGGDDGTVPEAGLWNQTGGTPNYTLLKLANRNDDGSIGGAWMGPGELVASAVAGDAADDGQDVELPNTRNMDPGESRDLSLVFDAANNALMSGDQIRCTLNDLTGIPESVVSVSDPNTDFTASEITPASDIVGNVLEASASGLTFEIASTPSSRTYVGGAEDVDLLGLTVRSGSSLDNTIKSVTMQGMVDGNPDAGGPDPLSATGTSADDGGATLKDIIEKVALFDGEDRITDWENINLDGTFTFDNIFKSETEQDEDYVVPKSTTNNLKLRGSRIKNDAPFGAASDRVAFGINADTDVVAIDGNGQTVSSGSIDVEDACNDGNGATAPNSPGPCTIPDVIMTISDGGTGEIQEEGSPNPVLMVGNSPDTLLAQYNLTSEDDNPSLRDVNFGILNRNGASVDYINLMTGPGCTDPVPLLGGGDSGNYFPNGATGIVDVDGLDLTISDSGDTSLCVFGATPSVSASGDPISGDSVGVVLLDVPEIIGGGGSNVSDKYLGLDGGAAAGKQPLGTLDAALTAVATAVDLDVDPDAVATNPAGTGDVIIIDQEQILFVDTTITAGANTVVRGFGGTPAVAHVVGSEAYTSSLAMGDPGDTFATAGDVVLGTAATDTCVDFTTPGDYQVGDIVGVSRPNTPGAGLEYMLITELLDPPTGAGVGDCDDAGGTDDATVIRGMFGSTPLSLAAADLVTELTERGPLYPLRASAPMFTDTSLSGDIGSGTNIEALKFDIEAAGENSVKFNKGAADTAVTADNYLVIKVTGSTSVVAANLGTCSLYNEANDLLDEIDFSAASLATGPIFGVFNFFDKELIINSGGSNEPELRCDTFLDAGTGETVQFSISEDAAGSYAQDIIADADTEDDDAGWTGESTVVYSDGEDTTVGELPSNISGLPIEGPTITAPTT